MSIRRGHFLFPLYPAAGIWYHVAVPPERGRVVPGTRNGHSPGTDRERQATQEGRHPNPPSDAAIQLQRCKAVVLLKCSKLHVRRHYAEETRKRFPLFVFRTRYYYNLNRKHKERFSFSFRLLSIGMV